MKEYVISLVFAVLFVLNVILFDASFFASYIAVVLCPLASVAWFALARGWIR